MAQLNVKRTLKNSNQHSNKSLFAQDNIAIINDDAATASSKMMLVQDRISVYDIAEREVNKFELSNVESLADSIRRVRLAQPILLREISQEENRKEKYEIVSGHRRYAAYRLLLREATVSGDKSDIDKYEKIPSLVLPKGATKEEIDDLYESTNLESRHLDSSDILRHIPYYLNEIESIDIAQKAKNPKARNTNKAKFIVAKFADIGLKISNTQIKDYIKLYENGTDELISLFDNGIISLTSAQKIARKFPGNDEILSSQQALFVEKVKEIEADKTLLPSEKETKKIAILNDAMSDFSPEIRAEMMAIRTRQAAEAIDARKDMDVDSLKREMSSIARRMRDIIAVENYTKREIGFSEDGSTIIGDPKAVMLSEEDVDFLVKRANEIMSLSYQIVDKFK